MLVPIPIPITRYLLFILLFLAGLTTGLIAFLPLSVVANEIQKNIPGITIRETYGQWWQGGFNQVSWQKFNHGTLSWTLNLAALFQGHIVAKIDVSQKVITASTELSMPISQLLTARKVEITGAQAKVEIDQLTPYAPYPLPNITGQLTLFVEHLVLDLTALNSASSNIPMIVLDSPIAFSTSTIKVLDNLLIGKYSGKIINTNKPLGYKLTVRSTANELNVSGHSILSSKDVKSQYLVQPNPKTDPQLTKLLDMMGQKLQNGNYSFNTVYAL
jgi:hypothetical protein